MTFAQIPAGSIVFVDANTLICHFANDPKIGTACTQLLDEIGQGRLQGVTSAHVLADVAHRLMTLEAIKLFNWPVAGIASRLRKHHREIPKLSIYRQAIAGMPQSGIQVLPITQALVEAAMALCQQHELLTGDALVVAVMQAHGITILASEDGDFDRVPWLRRYEPA
jgi:predicted nucleic acid-binding protein